MNEYSRQDPVIAGADSTDQSSAEIERDIERTRERMTGHIDALGDKLSPDNLKQQARDAISEKAQDVVDNVNGQAREAGSRMLEFITEHPLPVAAVTLGAIWLIGLRKGDGSEVSGDRMARFAYTGPERREPNGRPGLGRRLADRAESIRDTLGDKASHAGERAGELKDRVQERANDFSASAKHRARDARGGFERLVHENPLAIAVGAIVIGVAVGMLLPETDPERQVMGSTRDDLADRVETVAGRVKDAAVQAGNEVKDAVRDEASAVGPDIKSSLKDAALNVKDQVKESAGKVVNEAKQEVRRTPPAGTG